MWMGELGAVWRGMCVSGGECTGEWWECGEGVRVGRLSVWTVWGEYE